MTTARELLAIAGFEFDKSFERDATASVANVVGAVQSLAQAFAGAAIVQAGARFVQNMIDVGSELADSSAQMGVSATELTEWRFAAQLAGVDAGELSNALARVSVLARSGGGGVFRRLGVETRGAGGELRRASDILEDTGLAIGALGNETERTAIATQVFGRAGRALIPLFRGTRGSIRELRAEVRQLYGTDLDRLAEVADEAGDNQDRLNLVFDALRTRLALSVLPAVTATIARYVELGGAFVELVRHSRLLEAGLAVVGAVAVGAALATIGAWGPPVLVFAAVAAAIAFVVLLVDDLLVLFDGGHSVIGAFVDELFGIGTAAEVVEYLRDAFAGVVQYVQDAAAAVRAFVASPSIAALQDLLRTLYGQGGSPALAGLETPTGSPAEEFLRRYHEEGPTAIAAEGAGPTTIDASRTVGTIVINGSGTPEATGREVRRVLASDSAGGVESAALDLVPEGI